MSKKTRVILLSVFAILFFLIAPNIILYSLGYRFDFERKKIVNTGGLYLKVLPSNVEIFIDGELRKKTGLFLNSALIQNLLPKKYTILVRKDGYHSWQKTLEIKEKEVIRAENIILIKENPTFKISKEDTDSLFFSPDIENSGKNKKDLPTLNNLITHEVFKDNIIWLEKSGFLYKSDFSGKIIEVLNIKPFPVQKNSTYKIISQDGIIFLQENETLFLLNPDSKVLEKFYTPVKNLKFSPNLKKIVFLNDYEIWFSDLSSKKLEKVFLTRFSEKIDDCFWLNPYYLIFNVGNKIKISEIDTRDGINIMDLAEFKNPKIFWNQNNKKLYILEGKTIFVSEKLIP